ncbi:hypothetical protein D3C78_1541070 [compost metagenome]
MGKVVHQAALRWANIIGGRDQYAGNTTQLDGLLHLQSVDHVITGQAHHHLMSRSDGQHCVEHRQLFVLV